MAGSTNSAGELHRMADAAEQELSHSGGAGKNRYMEAMIANARTIAGRMADAPDHETALLSRLKDARACDMAALARGMRDGTFNDETVPGLADALREYVRAELAVTNPGFLAKREGERAS